MLASPYDAKLVGRIHWPAMTQLKMDGMRFNAIVNDGKVEFRTRNGREIDLLGELEEDFITLAAGEDLVFDGELIVVNAGQVLDRKTGNGILNKSVKGTINRIEAAQVEATLWDIIPLADFKAGECRTIYGDRFNRLRNLILTSRIHLVEWNMVNNIAEAQAKFTEYFNNGHEGIILKDVTEVWENKRAKHQIKFKGELECDLRCIGWEEGTGKNAGRLGALVLESLDGAVKVNVGSGFSDDDRNSITAFNSVGRIVTVKYNARINDKSTGQGSLFLPVFIEFRSDKFTPDSDKDIK